MKRLPNRLYFLLLILFPTQLSKHFWLTESLILGRKIDYLSPTIYLTDILILIFVTVVVWQVRPRLSRGWFCSLLIVLLLVGVSLISSKGSLLGFYQGLKFLEWWCLAWGVAVLNPPMALTVLGLSAAAIWTSFLALLQFLSQNSQNGIWYWFGERAFSANTPGIAQLSTAGRLLLRPYATLPHPNVLGGILVLISPFLLFAKMKNKQDWCLLRIAQGFVFLGVGLSFGRGAWAVAAFILASFLIKKPQVNKYWQVLFFGGIFVLMVEELLVGRFVNLFQVDQVSLWERQRLMVSALRLWLESPILGIGLNRFITLLPQVSPPPFVLQPAHSIFILWLTETGILGVLAGLILLFFAFRRALLNKKNYLVIAWLALLFLGMTDHYWLTLQQGQLLFSLLIGLTFARHS